MSMLSRAKLCAILPILITILSGCAFMEEAASDPSETLQSKAATCRTVEDAPERRLLPAPGYELISELTSAEPEPDSDPEYAKIYFYDMGQAECILIQTRFETILVDAGAELYKERQYDLIRGYLEDAGVERIDFFILTHPHPDHIGEAAGIVADYDIGEIYMPNVSGDTEEFERLAESVEAKGMTAILPERGDIIELDAGTLEFVSDSGINWGNNLNNWSLGFRLSFPSCVFLMCGDMEAAAEKELAESGTDIGADVLKITHHGSITSSTELFLDAVEPTYAVISCGLDNIYGNPYQEVLDRLEDRGITYYRTDHHGTITATVTLSGVAWETEK